MKKRTLAESLKMLQELDYVPGVSMVVPDPNYTLGQRNFDPVNEPGSWPYEDDSETEQGPANATGETGQSGVGRGGVGWGGRSDKSGGTRRPSAAYDRTWQQEDIDRFGRPGRQVRWRKIDGGWTLGMFDESPDYDEEMRHGKDKYRNVWCDTPDGKRWTRLNRESMGSPMQVGPVPSMDGPQHNVLRFSDDDIDDMLARQDNRGPAGQWGGPSTVPAQSRGWSASPAFGDKPEDVWRVPDEKEENAMKLREFFCPEPVPVEEVDNPDQDHFKDQSDARIEDRIEEPAGDEEHDEGDGASLQGLGIEPGDGFEPSDDENGFAGRLGGSTISIVPSTGPAGEFLMSPDKMGAARGTYGIHTDSKKPNDLVDKQSAWDVLQWVVASMGKNLPDRDEEI